MSLLARDPVSFVLPEEDRLFEVVNGQRVEKSMGFREINWANVLAQLIASNLGPAPSGRAFVEGVFRLRNEPRLDRRPGVAFVPFDRWPTRSVPEVEAWEINPSLAVEIISKNNTAYEVQKKIEEYFQAGVNQVWVVYPEQKQFYVYESPKSIRILDENDTLDGGPAVPGFKLALRDFFQQVG